jgi:hypothetical protein
MQVRSLQAAGGQQAPGVEALLQGEVLELRV